MRTFLAALAAATIVSGATAAPIGPVRPQAHRWQIGAEIGFQLENQWQLETRPEDLWENDRRSLYLGRFAYGIDDRWEVFGRLGAASLKVVDVPDGLSSTNNHFDMGSEFAWGAGVRGIAVEDFFPGFNLAIDGQYLQHSGHDGKAEGGVNVGIDAQNWDMWEWSIALLFQTAFEPFEFYTGPVLSDAGIARGSIGGIGVSDLEIDENAGYVVGLGFDFIEGGRAYFEGRLIDETAINTGFVWTF